MTFGAAPGLGAAQFTLELWFKRTGAGVGTSTGSGGVTSAIPLITKGRAEAEGSNVDMNYFFGIDAGSSKLVADFEEGATGSSPGLNHPVTGTAVVTSNVWHHAAVTYDGTWKIYLDGQLDPITVGTAAVNQPPRSDSIQHAAIGTAMTSSGAAAGFFAGAVDEARLWNVARTQAQIQAAKNTEISSAQTGLLGYWNLNEGEGVVANNTFGTANVNGTAVAAPTWTDGFRFDTTPPAAPQNLTASVNANGIGLSWNANPESDLAGYNVYRGTSPGVPTGGSPLNGALLTTTSFTDTSVAAGTAYYYVVTAVDTANNASQASNEVTETFPAGNYSLDLNGSTQYASMGQATQLDASSFTIELWFKRTGTGVATSTGSGGFEGGAGNLPLAIPLLTKGRAEQETPANVNMNYFLGIDSVNGVLVGDFEDASGGANHPVSGATSITSNVWHHAAATFDGSTFRLYLDGRLDGSVNTTATPESTSIQHFGLGTAMNSSGVAAGFFAGLIDEARVWNVARTGAQIRSAQGTEITDPQTGLLGRWGLEKGSGTVAANSAGSIAGTIAGAAPWVTGYQFAQDITAPAAPSGFTATAGDGVISLQWSANGEPDVAGYNLFRSTSTPVDTNGTPLNGASLLTGTTYTDASVANGTAYHYVLVAVDTSDNRSAPSTERTATPQPPPPAGLALNGSTRHVTFGRALGLDSAQFTLELWIKRTGAGTATSTGSGGFDGTARPLAIPLLTKGHAEAETPANVNMNYFLGIDSSTGVLVADFEDTATGANHPVSGQTQITSNVWHHVAATYDGTTWRLYLDGRLDGSLAANATPESTSIQHAAIGTAMNSTGVADGHFAGVVDEARVWNYARTQSQISSTKNDEVTGAQAGLLGRWGMNEGSGTTIADSSGQGITGTITDALGWTDGFVPPPPPPGDPVLNSPSDGAQNTTGSPTLDVTVSDPDGKPLTVTFWGRPFASGQYQQLSTSTNIASGGHASTVWANLGDGQTFEWYVTVDNGVGVATGPVWTFSTANGADPVFVGAGDVAKCDSPGDEATGAIIAKINGTVFTTGDNVYVNGTAAEFADCYDPSWGPVKGRTRPVPGNHDWNTGNLNGYFGYYGMANASDANGKSYYSYDIDSRWHAVVLDTECAQVGGCGAGSPQEAWLRADLAAHLDDNIIVLWHKPRFSSGATNLTELQTFFQDIYDAGADLLLVGHDHVYERFQPLNPQGQIDTAAGVRVFTLGTGGAEHHSFSTVRTGSVVRNSDTWGVMKFTLHANSYDWTFLPEAGRTFTDSGTAPVNSSQNAAPTASAQSVSVVEDTARVITLQGTDADGDALTFAKATAPGHGSLGSISTPTCGVTPNVCTATVTYTPAANYNGSDSFTFTVSDSLHTSAPATVSITVTPVNDAPVAAADTYNVDQHTSLQVAAPGVLANDTDAEGSALTAVSPTQPAHGTLTLNANGSFTYTPVASYTGIDSFTYAARDGSLQSAPATVTLTVRPDTTPPQPPSGLTAQATTTTVVLDWANNTTDADLAGYDVYGSSTPTGPFTKLNQTVLTSSDYRDDGASVGTTSYYEVKAVDVAGNPSTAATTSATRTIALRSTASAANKGATSLTIPRPAGVTNTDVLVATIDVLGAPSTINSPAGWTVVTNVAAGTSLRHVTYVRAATATEPASYVWSWSGRQGASGGIAAYRGVDRTTPVDRSQTASSTSSSTTVTAPSIATTVAGDALVATFGIGTNPTFTTANGMDERFEVAGASVKVGSALDDQMLTAVGVTGSRSVTSSKAGVSAGATIALRPAGAGGSGDTQPPSTPQNLQASATATRVDLTWTASTDNIGVDHYIVYRDGVAIDVSPTNAYTDASVSPSTQYSYTVSAMDAAGNESGLSTARQVTTSALSGIAFRAASQASANATSISLARPSGSQVNDVLVASLNVKGQRTIAAPSGWQAVGTPTSLGTTNTQAAFVHVVTSADAGAYSWSFGTKTGAVGVIVAYAGVDTASPIAASDVSVNATASTTLTAPSLNATSGQMLIGFFGTTLSASITPPTGSTERVEVGNGSAKLDLEASERRIITSGATGPLSATSSKAAASIGRSILLAPAP